MRKRQSMVMWVAGNLGYDFCLRGAMGKLHLVTGIMRRLVLFLFCFLAPVVGPATGCETVATQTVPRLILALYDGLREQNPADTRIHRFLELPLNHLGYRLIYHDVARGDMPGPMDNSVAGAVSWFDAPLADTGRFAAWAVAAQKDCPDKFSFIVLGETGLMANFKPRADEALYLRRLGLEWIARSTLLGNLTEVTNSAAVLPGFETDFVFRPGRYASLRAVTPADKGLSVVPAGKGAGGSIDLIVQHDPNVFVHQSATLDADSRSAGHFWIMDPFEILGRALSRPAQGPLADVTTLNGRRIYFETVGPEGWLAPAAARAFDEEPRLGSENLLTTLLMPFPDVPVTVSVVTGDLDPAIGGKPAETGQRIARRIFDLPQTSVATSGRSLVRQWQAMAETPQTAAPNTDEVLVSSNQPNQLLAVLGRNLRQAFADPNAPAEPQLSDGLRQYGQDPFVVSEETADAIKAVRALTPKKGTSPLFLWSGDGRPAQDARAAVTAAGSSALGGGDSVIGANASLSELSPFLLADGPQVQVYHALPGDLGNLGYPSKDVEALQGLGLLVSQTDRPLRLKPFQLAYSAGSANQFATRSAIERLKRMAASPDTIAIFASRYVGIVEGFTTVSFKPEGTRKWRVNNRGGLQTIRFDSAQGLSLDLANSQGVIGARRINASLYVAFDPASVAPLVALVAGAVTSGMTVPVGHIGISDSNMEVVSATIETCLSVLSATGWGNGEIGFYGDPGARYRVSVGADAPDQTAAVLHESAVVADATGFASLQVPTLHGEVETITLRQDCAG